jgi:WXG100 family type VII secretion target
MTAYDVDLDELATVIAAMASCERDLRDLAADVEAALATLHAGWEGLAGDAHAASHSSWRASFGEMSTALTGLRSLGDTARSNYVAAVEANVAMWERVR